SSEPTAAETLAPRRLRLPALSGPVLGLVIVLALFVVLIGSKDPRELQAFLGLRNIQVLVQECTVPGVAALGMLLVIISGGIDLSAGSVLALVTVVAMRVYRGTYPHSDIGGYASLLAISAGIAVGVACGFINGSVITRLLL